MSCFRKSLNEPVAAKVMLSDVEGQKVVSPASVQPGFGCRRIRPWVVVVFIAVACNVVGAAVGVPVGLAVNKTSKQPIPHQVLVLTRCPVYGPFVHEPTPGRRSYDKVSVVDTLLIRTPARSASSPSFVWEHDILTSQGWRKGDRLTVWLTVANFSTPVNPLAMTATTGTHTTCFNNKIYIWMSV